MKISTTISLDEQILEEARAFAESERRSFSAQLEVWIEEKLASIKMAEPQPEEAAV
jgi:hypothetical protein